MPATESLHRFARPGLWRFLRLRRLSRGEGNEALFAARRVADHVSGDELFTRIAEVNEAPHRMQCAGYAELMLLVNLASRFPSVSVEADPDAPDGRVIIHGIIDAVEEVVALYYALLPMVTQLVDIAMRMPIEVFDKLSPLDSDKVAADAAEVIPGGPIVCGPPDDDHLEPGLRIQDLDIEDAGSVYDTSVDSIAVRNSAAFLGNKLGSIELLRHVSCEVGLLSSRIIGGEYAGLVISVREDLEGGAQ